MMYPSPAQFPSLPPAQDGVFVDAAGKVVAHVYGFCGTPPAGQTFRACNPVGLAIGAAAPSAADLALPPTDAAMARVCEDLIATLVAKKVFESADLPPAALARVNARRALRGEPAL
jgi:hypothetical protein